MEHDTVITGLIIDEQNSTLTFTQVCQTYQISKDVIIELIEHGLFNSLSRPIAHEQWDSHMLTRLQSARRLRDDLGLNSSGAVLVLELRDELDAARCELAILKRHFGDAL